MELYLYTCIEKKNLYFDLKLNEPPYVCFAYVLFDDVYSCESSSKTTHILRM